MMLAARIVILAADVLFGLLCARAICTWFFQFRWPWLFKVYDIACKTTDFIVRPCEKLTSRLNTGMLDLSVLLACLVIIFARNILLKLIFIF